MEIIISTNSKKPIYEQIVFQIKAQIMEGTLQSGMPMPSMRALAKSLHVSVIVPMSSCKEMDSLKPQWDAVHLLLLKILRCIRRNNSARQRNTWPLLPPLPMQGGFRCTHW